MRDLDLGPQQDVMAERRHAMAELDVLDLRSRERPFVVHADRHEHVATNAAAAAPERLGVARLLRVREVVEQVAVLRHELAALRLRLVRAEHRAHLRTRRHRCRDAAERVGVDDDVGVDEHHEFAACELDAAIAGVRRPARAAGQTDHEIRVLAGDRGGVVGARIIDDDELPALRGISLRARFAEQRAAPTARSSRGR